MNSLNQERQVSTPRLHCELITDFARLERLAPEWERLFQSATPPGGIFQSWSWAHAFWKVHGQELALCAPVVFEGDAVIGILPVAVRGRTAQLLGAPYADYNGLLCVPERAAEVMELVLTTLLEAPLPWKQCVFKNLPEASPMIQRLHSLPARLRRRLQAVFGYTCAAAINDDGNLFDRLSRKKSLRYDEKKLGRRGNLRFRHIEDRQEILSHLDDFFRMQIARHAMNSVRSPLLSPSARAMMTALVEELDPARELRFCVLELNGRVVACEFGFRHAGTLAVYMPTFDIDFYDDSPGDVLLRNVLQYAHEQGLSEFDFTIGDEQYKNRFSNQVRRTFDLYFDRSPGMPQVQVRRLARGTRDTVRRHPPAARCARWIRNLIRGTVEYLRAPAALARLALLALERLFRMDQVVICHRTRRTVSASEAKVERLSLKDLALLRLEHVAVNEAAIETFRRRTKQGDVLYSVSLRSAQFLFWVSTSTAQVDLGGIEVPKAAAVIREGPVLGGASAQDREEALAALLGAIEFPGDLWVCVRNNRHVQAAIEKSGHGVLGRLRRISLLGRTRLASWAGGSPADFLKAKEEEEDTGKSPCLLPGRLP